MPKPTDEQKRLLTALKNLRQEHDRASSSLHALRERLATSKASHDNLAEVVSQIKKVQFAEAQVRELEKQLNEFNKQYLTSLIKTIEKNRGTETLLTTFDQETASELAVKVQSYLGTPFIVMPLGGSNNRNFTVIHPGYKSETPVSWVLTLSDVRVDVLEAVKKVHRYSATYLATTHAIDHIIIMKDGQQSSRVIRVVDKHASFTTMVEDLHTIGNTADIIAKAQQIGIQTCDMLTVLNRAKVIWVDFKPGNLLIDGDGNIKVSDIKGFVSIPDEQSAFGKNTKGYYLFEADTSRDFLSDDFYDALYNKSIADSDVTSAWQSQYSYQMAVLLYYIATGDSVIRPHHGRSNPPAYVGFDFDKAIFRGDDGKRLAFVIKLLSGEALGNHQRISIEHAKLLLTKIGNKKQFESTLGAMAPKYGNLRDAAERELDNTAIPLTPATSPTSSIRSTPQRVVDDPGAAATTTTTTTTSTVENDDDATVTESEQSSPPSLPPTPATSKPSSLTTTPQRVVNDDTPSSTGGAASAGMFSGVAGKAEKSKSKHSSRRSSVPSDTSDTTRSSGSRISRRSSTSSVTPPLSTSGGARGSRRSSLADSQTSRSTSSSSRISQRSIGGSQTTPRPASRGSRISRRASKSDRKGGSNSTPKPTKRS